MTNKERKKLIANALDRNFNRKEAYPSLTVKGLRDYMQKIPSEYDDCMVGFGFVMQDHGEDPVGSGLHNFSMGILPMKSIAAQPDQLYVILCDDELTEYMIEKSKNKVSRIRNQDSENQESDEPQ